MSSSSCLLALALLTVSLGAALPEPLQQYFRNEVSQVSEHHLDRLESVEKWENGREEMIHQLREMLSLDPLPSKNDLQPVITGTVEREGIIVEKLHFQSRPGLYVTGNLYRPRDLAQPAPAVLYLCGHGQVKSNGISYGNKVFYQHHGVGFARHGYVCLVIDTLQLGEIESLHHGTSREGLWWWNSRGYTPAGVEAWNAIRSLDYLQTRAEVDPNRIGVTGRSGGGAYSWWVGLLDSRVKVAAPVAGITDLQDHVLDGIVSGHCDCMYVVNTYRWDYPLIAALAAPRPLLIGNSDQDRIFPLDGVQRLHSTVARLYATYRSPENLGLLITPGGHKDTQDLQVPVFRWFNKHLQGEESVIVNGAVKLFAPEELRVFRQIPADQLNTRIHEVFVPTARAEVPSSTEEWKRMREQWMNELQEKVFGGWPYVSGSLPEPQLKGSSDAQEGATVYLFESQPHVSLGLLLLEPPKTNAKNIVLVIPDESQRQEVEHLFKQIQRGHSPLVSTQTFLGKTLQEHSDSALAVFLPRTVSLNDQKVSAEAEKQIRRRYMLVGQTLDGMRVFDVLQALNFLSQTRPNLNLTAVSEGRNAVNLLYASLFTTAVNEMVLERLPASHRDGPDYLNVLRFLDIPQALAMSMPERKIVLMKAALGVESYAEAVAETIGIQGQVSRYNHK